MRVKDETWILFNLAICILCLTYLYYKLDKDLAHVYAYAKTLDSDMVRMLNDIEAKYADVPKVQNAST